MSADPSPHAILLGAGCAGLACARAFAEGGGRPIVVEKARGVGGRCATRRLSGQPVDFGALFYHGSRPDFLGALDAAARDHAAVAWPEIVEGDGPACLARAFKPRERRIAFRDGMTVFPKTLARGLDVRLETRAQAITLDEDHLTLELADGSSLSAATIVLALPAEQAGALLATLPATRELDSIRALLGMVPTEPCLTVAAGYPLDTAVPDWDVWYPEEEPLILAAHDSRKRSDKRYHAFVYQCSAKFSRSHLEAEPADWVPKALDSAAALLGAWARTPEILHPHRWRFGRATGCALSDPLLVTVGNAKIGIAGDMFDDALGAEGAFSSGRKLGRLLLADARG